MGLFSGLAKVGKAVFNNPIVKPIAKSVPGVSTAYTVFDVGSKVFGGKKGGGPGALPPPPGGGAFGFDMAKSLNAQLPQGPQMPQTPLPANGIMPTFYQPIEGENTTKVLRCRPGYVMVEYPSGSGMKVCMMKESARAMKIWRPAKKPPISVKDWQALGRADRTIKKLKSINSKAKRIANFGSTTRRSYAPKYATVNIEDGPGSIKNKKVRVR